MKVALVMPFFDEAVAQPHEMLARYPLLRELPPALAARGHDVAVLHHAPADHALATRGVRYAWISPSRPVLAAGRLMHRWKPRHGPAYYQVNVRLVRALQRLRPDVVHAFGLTLDLQLALIARATSRLRVPLLVHYHGGLPATRARHLRLQRHNLARIDRVLFTAAEQARPWIDAGLLRGPDRHSVVVETSSPFTGMPREVARARTGMVGNPVCLSAGRLHPIKDPLTMLRGFARVVSQRPAARLYLCYLTNELEPDLRAFIEQTPRLADRVTFLGRVTTDEMEAVYAGADVLLQASVREWSGLAVIEAMSCGCVPVVTDIPSFRALTDDGRVGRLFPVGDDEALARAVLSLDDTALELLRRDATEHFKRRLSFSAMASQLDAVYRAAGATRRQAVS